MIGYRLSIFIIALSVLCHCKTRKAKNSIEPVVVNGSDSTIVSDTLEPQTISIKEFYKRACGTCHELHDPSEYNAVEWRANLNKMQKRAMISDKDVEDLHAYLTGVVSEK